MATAPEPRPSLEDDPATKLLIMKVKGVEYRLAIGNVPIQEKMIVQKATGMAFESLLGENQIGEVSLSVLVWLARRAAGEIGLTYEKSLNDWPSPVTAGDLEVVEQTPDPGDSDPEA